MQLFDSWAGSLSPDEYARFALPATRAVLEGVADLGVPTILFGVGTGELLGAHGLGRVRRGRRRLARPARRGAARGSGTGHALQGNLDPALCLAPWPVVEDGDADVLARADDGTAPATSSTSATASCPRPDPGILAAVVELVHAETARGMTTGRPAHGARHAGEPGGDRALLHAHPARPPARARSSWPSSSAATRAIGGVSPLAERTGAQVDAVRAALEARAPGPLRGRVRRQAHRPAHRGRGRQLARAGVERVIGLVLTPHGSSMGSQEYLDRAAAALPARRRFVAVGPWYAEPGFVALLADACRGRARTRSRAAARVIFTAHSLPERIREAGDTYPEQLAESARLVADAAGLRRVGGGLAERGRTPEPWLGPDVRDVVRRLAAEGGDGRRRRVPDRLRGRPPRGALRPRRRLAAVAAECGLAYARTASLNDDPAFVAVLADVITAADEAP